MSRRRAIVAVALALVLMLAACGGGGGDEDATPSPAPSETPSRSGTPPALPPEFIDCMADRGFAVESPAEIHSAPPEVLQACFGALH